MDVLEFIMDGTIEVDGAGMITVLDTVGKLMGENAHKHIMQVVSITGGHVLAGAFSGVTGGVSMIIDMYQLKTGIERLVDGSEEGVQQIRDIADQLEEGLRKITGEEETKTESQE